MNPPMCAQLCRTAGKLHEKPEAKKEVGGNLNQGEDEKKREQRDDPRMGEEEEVGTQHSRNGT